MPTTLQFPSIMHFAADETGKITVLAINVSGSGIFASR